MINKFNQFIKEYKENKILSEQELLEMANVSSKVTGIDDIVLWIGPNPNSHWKRIKVSNVPNKFDGKDCFTLTIPDFRIIGKINKSLIKKDVLDKIIHFVELNIYIISDYSDYKMETIDMINSLKKV